MAERYNAERCDGCPPAQHERAIKRLYDAVGEDSVIGDPVSHHVDNHLGLRGQCLLAIAPRTVQHVSAAVAICHEEGLSIVPQGGRTGLVGGALPVCGCLSVVIFMGNLGKVRTLAADNLTVTVDAGMVLADLQEWLEPYGLRFPLDLGSARSCQVGGLIATNAGGLAAMRFGSARELVLGLEVVLPTGEIWDGLRTIRKDNTGYDLKQCYIGSEGTLGVITGAVLKLALAPRTRATALVALSSLSDLVPFFVSARRYAGEFISAFELISSIGLDHALDADRTLQRPFARQFSHYALIELESCSDGFDLRGLLEGWLEDESSVGRVLDAVVAQTLRHRAAFWRIRELTPWGGGDSIQFDVSVPIDQIHRFLTLAQSAIARLEPDASINAFGHVGDGNIHFHVCPPSGTIGPSFKAMRPVFSDVVHGIVVALGGSFSAEHGIGLVRKPELKRYKPALDLLIMQKLKAALDPRSLMNPGKIL